MPRSSKHFFFWIVLIVLPLSACQPERDDVTPTATASQPSPIKPATVSTPTPAPEQRALTICLGQEPNTLYPYDAPNDAALSVLSAIYDSPLDNLSYTYQPGILQKTPSLEDGDARLEAVVVSAGDKIVDVDGNLVTLEEGMRVYPSGCTREACIITYNKSSQLEMDQMVVTFSLIADLRWADGTPLTADDSIYAYDLAASASTPISKYLIERTDVYEAEDSLSVTWRGVPGYRDNTYMANFWTPMPYHLWSAYTPGELLEADASARFPLGWGAYIVSEWTPGEEIRLVKNPIYHRADEGLPKMDVLIFRFLPDPDVALSALLDGECDLLDPNIPLDGQVALLKELDIAGQAQAYVVPVMSLEQLAFGIRPASHDDGAISGHDRADIFGDKKMRQAVAMCLDRGQVVNTVLHGFAFVPNTYIPNEHPLYDSSVPAYPFDVNEGAQLLDDLGWKDFDNDASTPREAHNVKNVPAGTPLVFNYLTTPAIQRRQASDILIQSLSYCGIGVEVQYLEVDEFYAPGPDGPLFGRNFDLAQFAMGSDGTLPLCAWYTTQEIPSAENNWLGANLSGYSNIAYDKACEAAMRALPGEEDYYSSYQTTQTIFAEDLPSIPLYAHLRVAAARPDFCGFSLDPTSSSALWNIEEFDYGDCAP